MPTDPHPMTLLERIQMQTAQEGIQMKPFDEDDASSTNADLNGEGNDEPIEIEYHFEDVSTLQGEEFIDASAQEDPTKYVIPASLTPETQDSEDECQCVEGAYDEEEGQEVVYKKFPTRSKKHIYWIVAGFVLIAVILGAVFGSRNKTTPDELKAEPNNGGAPAPTQAPKQAPTQALTQAPTPSATKNLLMDLLYTISGARLSEAGSPQARAASFLFEEDRNDADDKTIQRYAMITLVAALVKGDELPFFLAADECDWGFATCSAGRVTDIKMSNLGLKGAIPPEISALQDLIALDMSSNGITGTLPEEFFDLQKLQKVYLDDNQLTGSVSPSISNMSQLEALYLGKNQFTGEIPEDLPQSLSKLLVRGLAQDLQLSQELTLFLRVLTGYINFYKNNFNGHIPSLLLKPNTLFYVDLSFNSLSGPLPANAASLNLRHLYLSHNQLSGEIPRAYSLLQLEDLFLDHNLLSGEVPKDFDEELLSTLQIHSNAFNDEVALDENICRLDIFEDGVLVDLAADCSICLCEQRLCNACY